MNYTLVFKSRKYIYSKPTKKQDFYFSVNTLCGVLYCFL